MGIKVGTYLFRRILHEGRDSRFDAIKKEPAVFFAVWMAQALWGSMLLMPVITLNAVPADALEASPGLTDVLGLGLFALGLGFETVADAQKSRWVHDKEAKLHDEQFMTRGLWKLW